jgi:predicted dehydrogenase/nucleoside-diphosphate-sugar epimerase
MWKVGILGAGYIAVHHVNALKLMPNVEIVAICDRNVHQAQSLKKLIKNDASIYSTLDEMLQQKNLDVVHVLLPPDLHFMTAEQTLRAGKHVFIEKPMCIDVKDCQSLCELAQSKNRQIGVNQNFLYYEIYKKLKQCLSDGEIGPLDHLTITWHKSLGQLHTGPYNIWMLRQPENLMIEVGPHLVSCLLDIVGNPSGVKVEASDPLQLPNGTQVYRRWMMLGNVGQTCVELRISLADGFEAHTIEARGRVGFAKVDFEKNIFVLSRHTDSSRPLDLYKMAISEAHQMVKYSWAGLWNYILSKCKLSKAGDPYFASILESIRSFYEHLPTKVDFFQSCEFSTQIITLCKKIADTAGIKEKQRNHPQIKPLSSKKAEILIIGGTGFIGKALVRLLTEKGEAVRLLVRNPDSLDSSLKKEDLEVFQGDVRDQAALKEALKGIKTVYHLARANAKYWDDYVSQGIEATRVLAEECLHAKIQRLIYTGTIDSYYAGANGSVITEETPLDPRIDGRNYYARCKAAEEAFLLQMHREKLLPVVIFRPGIVLGMGSSPFHWGVGMWHYSSICQLWGRGDNPLPFVWVDDVAKGLITAKNIPEIEGESFNLIDQPCLSGKEYVRELSQALQTAIELQPTPIWKFYLYDYFKWIIKLLVRHPERKMPTYRDWASRQQLSRFDCSKALRILEWTPLGERAKIIEECIYKPAKDWMR